MAVNSIPCPQCGAENPKNNRFCDTCGAKLAKPDEAAAAAPKAVKAPAAKAARAESLEPLLARQGFVLDANFAWMLAILAFSLRRDSKNLSRAAQASPVV